MLEISLNTDTARLAPLARSCGLAPSAALYSYTATDRERELAAGLFQVESEQVVVRFYRSQEEDPFLFDAVLRAGLNYASGQGIRTGCIPEHFRQEFARYFSQLNYPAPICFDITNFFAKYKSCRPR